MKAKEYLKQQFEKLKQSFKSLDKSILMIVLYDLIMVTIPFFTAIGLREFINRKGIKVLDIDIATEVSKQSASVLKQNMVAVESFYHSVIAYLIIAVIIILALYILTRFLVWCIISKNKFKKKFALKFTKLTLPWLIGWGILGYAILSSVRAEMVILWMVILIILYSHFTTIMYSSFMKKGKIKKSYKQAFNMGIMEIYKLLIPYIFAGIIFYALNILLNIFRIYVSEQVLMFTGGILSLFFIAWLRIYIYSIARELA